MEDLHCWQEKLEPCCYSERLINKITSLNKKHGDQVDINQINKAIFYCKKYHANQKRLSGEPYYSHPLEVTFMVADYIFNTDILVTSVLHDTIEDTPLTKQMIATLFNFNIANQVEALTRIKVDRKITILELIQTLLSLKNYYDLLVVKYFDRIHNMQTIAAKLPNKIAKTAEETFKIFLVINIYLSSKNPDFLSYEKQLAGLCYRYMNLKQQLPLGSETIFEDNFLLPSPIYDVDR